MIEWKKYDPGNPPERMKVFLLLEVGNKITTGRHIGNGSTWWEHDRFQMPMHNVTHYAEINFPFGE